jgi:hypothetical protein
LRTTAASVCGRNVCGRKNELMPTTHDLISRFPDGFDLRVVPEPGMADHWRVTLSRLGLPDGDGRRRTIIHGVAFVHVDAVDELVVMMTARLEP